MESIITGVAIAIVLFFGARFFSQFKPKSKAKNLHFNSNEGAFQFASENHIALFLPNQMSVGIVRDVVKDTQGQQFIIELADSNNQIIVSGINDKNYSSIQIGNLVYWGFIAFSDENILQIKATGYVLAVINPEFNPNSQKWVIRKDLTK